MLSWQRSSWTGNLSPPSFSLTRISLLFPLLPPLLLSQIYEWQLCSPGSGNLGRGTTTPPPPPPPSFSLTCTSLLFPLLPFFRLRFMSGMPHWVISLVQSSARILVCIALATCVTFFLLVLPLLLQFPLCQPLSWQWCPLLCSHLTSQSAAPRRRWLALLRLGARQSPRPLRQRRPM